MPYRANASSVNQVGLDAATISVLFFVTGGVSFCSGVDAPEVLDSEPKVTPPSLVYTPSDLTSARRGYSNRESRLRSGAARAPWRRSARPSPLSRLLRPRCPQEVSGGLS